MYLPPQTVSTLFVVSKKTDLGSVFAVPLACPWEMATMASLIFSSTPTFGSWTPNGKVDSAERNSMHVGVMLVLKNTVIDRIQNISIVYM